ncbi:MAG: hypothetical protein V1913_01955 [Fibrobacterota bacterium]
MKLFTIGDSISQGFMSGSASRTQYAYSTLIAKCMGLFPGSLKDKDSNYYFPAWQAHGIPASIEEIFRAITEKCGADISLTEWPMVLKAAAKIIDESEDYYERGGGAAENQYPGRIPFFHNVSVRDFTVADAWAVTPDVCWEMIESARAFEKIDGLFTAANAFIYRTALKVLSPNLDCSRSQLDWLKFHAQKEGVDNLILFLGANNALRTVVTLTIKETPNDPARRPASLTHKERVKEGWNLWHPADFEDEYRTLLDKVEEAMKGNRARLWRVFLGTVPLVTALPLLKGLGQGMEIPGKGFYFDKYTFFPFDEKFADESKLRLTRDEAIHIDDNIRAYNATIKALAAERNAALKQALGPFHVVDIFSSFNQIAWQRNNGKPTYEFPPAFAQASPKVDSRYYHADVQGRLVRGGLFSLDGLHPTAIAQGLLAHEFIKVMEKEAMLKFRSPLDWADIFKSEPLTQRPIPLMQELYRHPKLAHFAGRLIGYFRK